VFQRYRLARVVTSIDAVNGMTTLDRQPEAVKQAAVADALLVTKTDMTNDAEAMTALDDRLQTINPTADRAICIHGDTDPAFLFEGGLYDPAGKGGEVADWLATEASAPAHAHDIDVNRHGDGIRTFSLTRSAPVSRGALGVFMQMLADQRGDDLLRLKGLVLLTDDPDRPAVVHGVQHVIHPIRRLDSWPEETAETQLVLIVRNIEKKWVEELWDRVIGSAYADLVV